VVRTNCLDCLDRTNVIQTKICIKVFEPILAGEPLAADISKCMLEMWAYSGDFISKIYAGTNAILQSLVHQQKQSLLERINQGVTSVKRFIKQNISDEFKQECMMILSGQHTLCNQIAPSVVIQEYDRHHFELKDKIKMVIVTINCGGKQPDSYKELVPLFSKGTPDKFDPDIIAVGLQEIVKLNALSIF
jgi:synaptojanin